MAVTRNIFVFSCFLLNKVVGGRGLQDSEHRFNYDEITSLMTAPVDEVTPLFIIEYIISPFNHTLVNGSRHVRDATDINIDIEKKAASVKDAVVELVIVADHAIYRRFLNQNDNQHKALQALRLYYTLYMRLMDQWFGALPSDDVTVRVQPTAILVSITKETSPFTELLKGPNPSDPTKMSEIDASESLRAFRNWITGPDMSQFPVQYDHAMLFTDYKMYRDGALPTSGLAYTNKICSSEGWSMSIMSEEGAFRGVYTSVHELTHNLGSKHDATEDCPANQNYIMAPTNYAEDNVAKNYFRFSNCSARLLEQLLRLPAASCLYTTARAPPSSRFRFTPPGQLMSPDKQCMDIVGPGSRACKGTRRQTTMCYRLWCKNPSTGGCTTLGHMSAVYGTECGVNHWCQMGECVPIPNQL